MGSNLNSDNNYVCIINDKYEIEYFNELVAKAYPDLNCGEICYEVFMDDNKPCAQCPIFAKKSDDVTVYHSAIDKWLNMRIGKILWPGCGDAHVLVANETKDIEHSLWHRLPQMGGYDVFFELNLTKNKYRKILAGMDLNEIPYEEESIDDLVKKSTASLVHEADQARFLEFWDKGTMLKRIHDAGNTLHGDFRERKNNGEWDLVRIVLVSEQGHGTEDEIVMAMFMVIHPKHEVFSEKHEVQLNHADDNQVTGLPTGEIFKKNVLKYIRSKEHQCCMMVLDVEHFRFFNKWYGRAAGDRLLRKIGDYLKLFDQIYGSYSGYCGGDNFCIVFEYEKRLADILWSEASDLVNDFEGITGFGILLGGYMIADFDCTFSDMYDYATTAMSGMVGRYQKEVCWYGEELVSDLEHELRLLPEIERGIAENEFVFYLQMKYALSQKKVVGAEALLRWHHKKRGLIMPGQFIPICEKNGMITKLDMYLWEEVCKTLRRWLDEGRKPVPISVNVSRRDFYEIDVPEYFAMLTKKYQISPKYIEIEITESAFVENAAILQNAETRFHENGFTVLIDDFGSGYSSLNMLKDIQADILKMDVKFLDLNAKNETKGKEIVKSIFDMASALQYTVVAEGVETEEQLSTLESIGCEYVQGYYFYRPMPVEQYELLLLGTTS